MNCNSFVRQFEQVCNILSLILPFIERPTSSFDTGIRRVKCLLHLVLFEKLKYVLTIIKF